MNKTGNITTIDLNCDLGEGLSTDALIIPHITSANIACGFHAGNKEIMKQTIELCMQHNVSVGAHPSWPDKENFGRTEMHKSTEELYAIVTEQLQLLSTIAQQMGTKLQHVKPHGALYNQSAKDKLIAATIAQSVKDFDQHLVLFGLSGSYSISEAKRIGLKTASEVFADRTYTDEGTLTPRSQSNALISDTTSAVKQAMQMVLQQTVTSVNGKEIPIIADTTCIHGDGATAVELCRTLNHSFIQNNIILAKVV
ncbi:MAG: 5-oxoprolinase subunit PxpA [Lacibacter sp.]